MNQVPFRPLDELPELDEWETRVNLAACYRLLAHFGMNDLLYTHVSARMPGMHNQFFMTPWDLHFSEIMASSLIKIDVEGKIVEPTSYTVNEEGFSIHSAIHRAREDAACVCHTHTPAGIAVSKLNEGLLPLNQTSLEFYNRVAYHDYEGVTLQLDERERLVADLGGHRAMILRNHGLLTAGRTIAEAFYLMYNLDQACQLQLKTTGAGSKVFFVGHELAEYRTNQYKRNDRPRGTLEWPALLRILDRKDPSYKD
ncbi:MAG: class II aldolase/adducin family protein [Mesorhizobium sp.]|uniref:class II aldolase/adducin family protein n=1 Tax=Mesorhizobium sp. TaxID=1871066 RepID=UPI000FE7790A|nr:class II aldolase/adducin family protein [Mesorhizobium sp.]RWP86659.1 MAG: class II aldolase/adducin family protein [Mesorhizobium sp.]TIM24189.1 MAG: class II aldolase/adducin family protein [Mesorhizobium sp.]